jgi:hypothetical protein
MSTFYQDLDRAGGFDYHLCQLPNLGWRTFRGPPADTSKPYLAFLGSAQTFGRFCERPFPSLLGSRLKLGVLNLSVGGAGPRHFQAPAYLDLVNGAEAVIVQILSGRSASNSLFDNSRWGNHEGQRRLDGATMRSEDFFRKFAETASPEEITKVVQETLEIVVTGEDEASLEFLRALKLVKQHGARTDIDEAHVAVAQDLGEEQLQFGLDVPEADRAHLQLVEPLKQAFGGFAQTRARTQIENGNMRFRDGGTPRVDANAVDHAQSSLKVGR